MQMLPELEDDGMLYPLECVALGDYRNGWIDTLRHVYTGKLYHVAQHNVHFYGNIPGRYYAWKSKATEVTE